MNEVDYMEESLSCPQYEKMNLDIIQERYQVTTHNL